MSRKIASLGTVDGGFMKSIEKHTCDEWCQHISLVLFTILQCTPYSVVGGELLFMNPTASYVGLRTCAAVKDMMRSSVLWKGEIEFSQSNIMKNICISK